MSFRALRRMAAEIDEQHREAMTTIADDLGERHLGGSAEQVTARRSFLKRAAKGGALAFGASVLPVSVLADAALAQTGGNAGGAPGTTPGTLPPRPGAQSNVPNMSADLQVVVFAQSVELAAVAAYDLAIGKRLFEAQALETARMFRAHHNEHASALGGIAKDNAVTTPNTKLVAEFAPRLQGANSVGALAQVLYDLEEGAAATYLFALGELEEWEIAGAASSILVVEGQHAVAWSTVLDEDPAAWADNRQRYVPNFQNDAAAFEPARYS